MNCNDFKKQYTEVFLADFSDEFIFPDLLLAYALLLSTNLME